MSTITTPMSWQNFILPRWPVASTVRALVTTRSQGGSAWPYGRNGQLAGPSAGGLNLGDHVGDDPAVVASNRARLPIAPCWLQQVHGTRVVCLDACSGPVTPQADAAFATLAGVGCAVLTADCLPVLLADRQGRVVGAAHAGWRGLAAGVVENLVSAMRSAASDADLVAYLGPCIGPKHFEVGPEVRAEFVQVDARCASAFVAGHGDRWLADLAGLARWRLHCCGIDEVYGGDHCTFAESDLFYSYRRDGITGRFASLIWIEAQESGAPSTVCAAADCTSRFA